MRNQLQLEAPFEADWRTLRDARVEVELHVVEQLPPDQHPLMNVLQLRVRHVMHAEHDDGEGDAITFCSTGAFSSACRAEGDDKASRIELYWLGA